MELLERIIYADSDKKEIGILQNFEIDVDLADTKDFELKMSGDNACMDAGYYWFTQGFEYGGIVDEVCSDSEAMTVTYKGRNARGILNSKILEPSNNNTRTLSGAPYVIFNQLIEECGLSKLFVTEEPQYGIGEYKLEVSNCVINGYVTLYDALMTIVNSINATFKMAYSSMDKKWHITIELVEDFSDYLNYCQDNSIQYVTENIINAVNHIVCVGDSGQVIHLFTDEYGTVQPYSTIAEPIEDSNYILDKRNQIITGLREYAVIYEGSASSVENYKNVIQPKDWATTFENYYYITQEYSLTSDKEVVTDKEYYLRSGTEDNYVYTLVSNPKTEEIGVYYEATLNYTQYSWYDSGKQQYIKVTSKPDDWDKYDLTTDTQVIISKHYYKLESGVYKLVEHPVSSELSEYYEYSGSYSSYYKRVERTSPQVGYEYNSIEGTTKNNYKALGSTKPDDWSSNYGSYFYRRQSGTGWEYVSVSGVNKNVYTKMTSKPYNWTSSYKDYYMIKNKKYVAVKGVKKGGRTVAPTFKSGKYYRKDQKTVAPSWTSNKYYWNDSITTAPEWSSVSSNVWKQENVQEVPAFLKGNTYLRVEDNYSNLVSGGLEKLEELRTSQKQEVKLEDFEVDIGDLVGGVDDITGYTMCEPVTNMIIKINEEGISIEYVVGGSNE